MKPFSFNRKKQNGWSGVLVDVLFGAFVVLETIEKIQSNNLQTGLKKRIIISTGR